MPVNPTDYPILSNQHCQVKEGIIESEVVSLKEKSQTQV